MKYGFIGCGNMGGAIARALSHRTHDILLSDRSGKCRELARELGCDHGDVTAVAETCRYIFLAVKPQMIQEVLAPIREILCRRRPVIITMLAGLEMESLERLIGTALPIIRIMPNTPVAVGKGTTLYCTNAFVTDAVLSEFLLDLQDAGVFHKLEERLINAGSALSGSGPAYLYLVLDAMADGAVACGLPRQKALELAAETMAGAAQMYLSTGQHPSELKDAVCSPGGSTIAGVQVLENRGFRGAVMDCIIAAYRRNLELG